MTLILRQKNTLFIFNICQKKEDIQIELIDLLTLKFCLFLFELLVLTCQYVELLLERLTNNSFDIIDRFILNRESYYPLGSKRRTHVYILKKIKNGLSAEVYGFRLFAFSVKSCFLSLFFQTKLYFTCLLYTSPSPRDATLSRMPSSA